MTAYKGHDGYATKASRRGEKLHTQWVKDIITEFGSDYKIEYSLTISDIVGRDNNRYAWKQNKLSACYEADGGFIYLWWNGKWELIGVCEHKHQNTDKNACERAPKYLTFMWDHEVFVSTSGPGFTAEMMSKASSATAKFLATAEHGWIRKGLSRGLTLSHNAESEEEFKKDFREFLEYRRSIMGHKVMLVSPEGQKLLKEAGQ